MRRRIAAAFGRRDEAARTDLVRPVLGTARAGGTVAAEGAEREDRAAVLRHLLGVVRGAERDALIDLAEREGHIADAIRTLRSRQADRRALALALLEHCPRVDAIRALRAAMTTARRPWVRLEAAGALARLGHLPPPAATVAVLGLGLRPPTGAEQAVLDALAVGQLDEVTRLSLDPDYAELRAALVLALGRAGSLEVLDTLSVHAHDADAGVRAAALAGVERLGHPAALPFVAPLARDPDPAVRAAAAGLLVRLTPAREEAA